ncbi:Protein MEMO1-like protein [Diplonema papillatum]|nr:Protein MEMO1-like protein [Diplonema papillatum]KAJ9437415.1 Protein MEMO1-like protein [Diplonema papillatum]KAJ9444075.1 Protein MEMO1-like protein [Diplonema papillatum]
MEDQDRPALQRYFAAAENTICGRNPITILLNTLALSTRQYDLKFVHSSQSSKCRTPHDSSVFLRRHRDMRLDNQMGH